MRFLHSWMCYRCSIDTYLAENVLVPMAAIALDVVACGMTATLYCAPSRPHYMLCRAHHTLCYTSHHTAHVTRRVIAHATTTRRGIPQTTRHATYTSHHTHCYSSLQSNTRLATYTSHHMHCYSSPHGMLYLHLAAELGIPTTAPANVTTSNIREFT